MEKETANIKKTRRQIERKVPGMPGIFIATYPSGRKTYIRRYRDQITGKKRTTTLGLVA